MVESFLTDCVQYVSVNNSSSDKVSVTSGNPQESVLGPCLFIYFKGVVLDHPAIYIGGGSWPVLDHPAAAAPGGTVNTQGRCCGNYFPRLS